MGSQNHREYLKKQKPRFQNQWFWFTTIGSEILFCLFVVVFSMAFVTHWFWNLGCRNLFGILDGFGYPMVGSQSNREYQKNKISVSMILVHDHWFWNLGFSFVMYSRWFSLPIGSEILVFLVVLYSRLLWLPIGSEILVFLFLLYSRWFWLSHILFQPSPFCASHAPLVFIGFTNGFCFHIGFHLRSCMPPMSFSMYWRAFLVNDVLASTRACVSK